MKRKIIFSSVALLLAIGLIVAAYRWLVAHGNAGYVIIGINQWVLETSLYVMVVTTVLGFVAFYIALRLISKALSLPQALKQRSHEQRGRRSQEALITGLLETTEGQWEKAERNLIRHAADSGLPLINYLTAARAAHSRGAHEQRDEYLNLARQAVPKAELAVALTRAELQLSTKQFDQALESLTHLNQIAPSHAAVLRLTHQLYEQMEDWEALHRLIPALHKNKVLMEAEIHRLEADTYAALLRRRAETRDAMQLRELWAHIPQHIRGLTSLESLYCAAMIESGAGTEVEELLRLALGRDWNETLLVLYGCIQMADTEGQLHHAETWLELHPRDPVLLRVLGKLALRIKQRDKARDYIRGSLDIEPSVEAYQLMGDLLFAQKDYVAASNYYRNGLMFASNEAVAAIEEEQQEAAVAESAEVSATPAET
ncbi:HemY protein [Methylomagnum ishizawai]|uniref:HemY protein n=1 Tax=Methylomagnum ishizawai TaxID=1760988 RepID=A0A1Y6D3I3_9GAMM|nr:heme biosynthesis HemY N-terminal domain-containing protein [Methylomagnum ishizawai]SMF97161.1 HemY protein [Methylomagnum ishizawai]